MPVTPNYGWTTPVINADVGAWGGILNAAFVEVDADVKALADSLASLSATVSANALNVARTNVNNAFAGTQSFAALTAASITSAAVTASGTLTGRQVVSTNAAAANNDAYPAAFLSAGADAVLGALGFTVAITPSATGTERTVTLQAADNSSVRALNIRSARTFVGSAATPTFSGNNEALGVGGVLYASGRIVTGAAFAGSGAELTNIPVSAVTTLSTTLASIAATDAAQDTAIAGKANLVHTHAQSDVTGLVAALAGKSDVTHTHDASAITSGTLAWARVANPPRIDFAAGTTQAFQFATAMLQSPGGTAAPAINRPGAYAIYTWSWVNVAPVGAGVESWVPVLTGANA